MPLQTNSTGVSFVYNNLQSTELSSVSGNTNAVTGIPFVTQLDAQSTLIQAGKVPGGTAFRQAPNVPYTAAGNTNAVIVQLDGFETQLSRLNGTFTKSGAFICVTSGTTAVNVPLTNTSTNTNSNCGYNVFAKMNFIAMWNLSGIDGLANSASMAITVTGTNGFNFGIGANGSLALQGGGNPMCLWNLNGATVNAANAYITCTPTAGGVWAVVVGGA